MNEGFPVARNSHCGLVAKATSSGTLTGPSDLTWPDGRQSKKAKGQSGDRARMILLRVGYHLPGSTQIRDCRLSSFRRGFSAAASLSAGSLLASPFAIAKTNTADIHVKPMAAHLANRYRIDGRLRELSH